MAENDTDPLAALVRREVDEWYSNFYLIIAPITRECLIDALTAALHGYEQTREAAHWEAMRVVAEQNEEQLAEMCNGFHAAEEERTTAQAECERLRGQLAAAEQHVKILREANASVAHREDVIAALRPFAEIEVPNGASDGAWVATTKFCNAQITAFSVRRARAALSILEQERRSVSPASPRNAEAVSKSEVHSLRQLAGQVERLRGILVDLGCTCGLGNAWQYADKHHSTCATRRLEAALAQPTPDAAKEACVQERDTTQSQLATAQAECERLRGENEQMRDLVPRLQDDVRELRGQLAAAEQHVKILREQKGGDAHVRGTNLAEVNAGDASAKNTQSLPDARAIAAQCAAQMVAGMPYETGSKIAAQVFREQFAAVLALLREPTPESLIAAVREVTNWAATEVRSVVTTCVANEAQQYEGAANMLRKVQRRLAPIVDALATWPATEEEA